MAGGKEDPFGFQPIPESNQASAAVRRGDRWRQIEFGSVTVATEIIDPKIIAGVVINPIAEIFLKDRFPQLVDPEALMSLTSWVMPLASPINEQRKTKAILVPNQYGRALPLLSGRLPYGDGLLGGVVFSLGSGLSGAWYPLEGEMVERPNREFPLGLYGADDAFKEAKIANALLESGFRSALVLGFAVLRPAELKGFLRSRWGLISPKLAEGICQSIDYVVRNGDFPAVMYRIGGTTDRLVGPEKFLMAGKEANPTQRLRAMVVRGASLMAQEMEHFPESWHRRLKEDHLKETERVFRQLGEGKPLGSTDSEEFSRAIIKTALGQGEAFLKTIKKYPNLLPLTGVCFDPQDVDFALICCDYEEYWRAIKTKDPLGLLGERLTKMTTIYLDRVKQAGLVTKVPDRELIRQEIQHHFSS